jgi:hypothetical protein
MMMVTEIPGVLLVPEVKEMKVPLLHQRLSVATREWRANLVHG